MVVKKSLLLTFIMWDSQSSDFSFINVKPKNGLCPQEGDFRNKGLYKVQCKHRVENQQIGGSVERPLNWLKKMYLFLTVLSRCCA